MWYLTNVLKHRKRIMKKEVLIVEDDVNISELIAIHLRDLDFEVVFI